VAAEVGGAGGDVRVHRGTTQLTRLIGSTKQVERKMNFLGG